MSIGDYTRHPAGRQGGRRGAKTPQRGRRESGHQVPLGQLFVYYLYALATTIVAKIVFLQMGLPVSLFGWIFAHLYAGYRLNRTILPYFRWQPLTSSVAAVASAKVSALIFWPVTYAVFLTQVWVVRYL